MTAITPFFHSFAFVYAPNNSLDVTAFGFKVSYSVSSPFSLKVYNIVFHTADFPQPVTPIIKTQWRTSRISFNYTTFVIKESSVVKPILLLVHSLTYEPNTASILTGGSNLGKRSPINLKKIYLSSW